MKFAPTPVGPDWAIAFNEGIVKHIYFVAETKACTGVGRCLRRRWRMPAQALADACTGVGPCLYGRWRMPVRALAYA
jgi:hypothetical protein